MAYRIKYTRTAVKDAEKLKDKPQLKRKVKDLLEIVEQNPYQNPPKYEKLVGDFQGMYSRRINIKHRLVYEILEDEKIVRVISMWSHYE